MAAKSKVTSKSSGPRKVGASLIKGVGLAALGGSAGVGLLTYASARYLIDQLTRLRPVEPSESYNFSPFETQVDFEEVSFPTVGGRLLSGWWLPRPGERKVVIAVSGYRGKKEDVLGISSFLWRNGYNVLLFDYRAHGPMRAEGELITLGHRELEDMQSAIAYAKSRLERPLLGLLGGSMGAAVALVATARDPEIKAVWADSSFTSQREIISHVWHATTRLPSRPVVDMAARIFEARTGFSWENFSPLREMPQLGSRPVYFVHASGDALVPVDQAYRLYAAAPGPKEMWIEEGLAHCGVYFAFRKEYVGRALKFFGTYLVDASSLASKSPVQAQKAGDTARTIQDRMS